MNIYKKLDEARKIIRESKVEKKGKNTYSKYDYFTPEQVEMLVAMACEKVKAICITSLKQDQFGYYQVLEFRDIETADFKEGFLEFELRTERPEIKATNATQQMGGMDTYSERYIKMKAFQIKDNNLDFDSQDNTPEKENPKQNQFVPYPKKAVAPVKKTERYQDAAQSAELSMQDLNDLDF